MAALSDRRAGPTSRELNSCSEMSLMVKEDSPACPVNLDQ